MIERLTEGQKRVLEQAIEGDSNQQIADKLGVQKGTVDKHIYNVTKRFNIRNKLVAVLAYSDEKAFNERQSRYTRLHIEP